MPRSPGRENRKDNTRKLLEPRWLIVCEGEKTEPNYFNGLSDFLNQNGSNKIKIHAEGIGKNTSSLVDHAEEYFTFYDKLRGKSLIPPYKRVIFAFDKDSFGDDQFNSAIKKAQSLCPSSIVAWSNESFELWLCLHYDLVNAARGRHDYNNKITEIFRKQGICNNKQRYEKGDVNLFDKILKSGGNIENAITNAEKLVSDKDLSSPAKINPATMMHKAVKALATEAGYNFI